MFLVVQKRTFAWVSLLLVAGAPVSYVRADGAVDLLIEAYRFESMPKAVFSANAEIQQRAHANCRTPLDSRVRGNDAGVPKLILVGLGGHSHLKSTTPGPGVSIDVTAPPARNISAYNLFRDIAKHEPNDGVVPYEINTPLFSDYAEKHRFVYVPEGKTATLRSDGTIAYPVGTVLVKTFSFPRDRRDIGAGERILETRLLMHRPEGWVGYPYVWSDDLSDARLAVAGARMDVAWVHDDGQERTARYKIPNMNECKQCHENGEVMGPIGPRVRQLNRDYAYLGGVENQLAHWVQTGILEQPAEAPQALPRLPVWDDPATGSLDARARAYLDVNCAHCHNPGGEAASTGLDLSWEQHEPVAFGVNKLPTAAGPASRGYKYAIRPGRPNRSFLLSRLRETDPAKMMPRTGRSLRHDEGIALLEAWIAGMDPEMGSETQYGTTQ